MRVCLGLVLSLLVIEPELYDEVFRDAVDNTDEGAVPARALPFDGPAS
jgi:hypothetical protein